MLGIGSGRKLYRSTFCRKYGIARFDRNIIILNFGFLERIVGTSQDSFAGNHCECGTKCQRKNA